MKKRVLSLVLSMVMCLSLLPTAAQADGGEEGSYVYEYQIYDLSGKPVNSESVESLEFYSDGNGGLDGLMSVSKNGKYGFMNAGGEMVVPFRYEYAAPFRGGLAAVKTGGKYGYIDLEGELVIDAVYDTAQDFNDYGFAVVGQGEWKSSEDYYGEEFVGKYGLIDKTGKVVVALAYDSFGLMGTVDDGSSVYQAANLGEPNENGYRSFSYGLVGQTGKVLVPVEYDGLRILDNGFLEVSKGESYDDILRGWMDDTGKVILPIEYSSIEERGDGYWNIYKRSGEYNSVVGLADAAGKVIIPAEYSLITVLDETHFMAEVTDWETYQSTYYLLDNTGNVLLDLGGSRPTDKKDGVIYAANSKDLNDYKYYNYDGKEITLPEGYRFVGPVEDGGAGEEKHMSVYSEGLFLMRPIEGSSLSAQYRFMDPTGKIVYTAPMSATKSADGTTHSVKYGAFYGGMAAMKDTVWTSSRTSRDRWGFVNRDFEVVVPAIYDEVSNFDHGLALVSQKEVGVDTLWGVIDTEGKLVVPLSYHKNEIKILTDLSMEAALIMLKEEDGTYTLLNNKGEKLLTGLTSDSIYFSSIYKNYSGQDQENTPDLVQILIGEGYGVVTTDGELVLSPDYSYSMTYQNGLLILENSADYKRGVYTAEGEEILPCEYASISIVGGGMICASTNTDYNTPSTGLFSDKGVQILPCRYSNIQVNGTVVTARIWEDDKEKTGVFDLTGKELLPLDEYDEVGTDGSTFFWAGSRRFIPSSYTANPTNDALKVDGVAKVPTAYKINTSNYFQLRDVAMLLNGTKGQFSVDYDAQRQAVVIVTGQPYDALGTELAGAPIESAKAILGNNDVYINGEKVDLEVYKINGANFFKIRDLGRYLGFNVGWTQDDGMFIQSDKEYTDAD